MEQKKPLAILPFRLLNVNVKDMYYIAAIIFKRGLIKMKLEMLMNSIWIK